MLQDFRRQALIAGAGQVKTRDMNLSANPGLASHIAATLDWWRDAGVDHDWSDAPQSWIAPPEPVVAQSEEPLAVAPARPEAPVPASIDRSNWPQTFDALAPWWLTSDWLGRAAPEERTPARGPAGAELMVLVGEPEPGDREILLSGPQGRLLDAMLVAMGLDPASVYRASVLPRAMPHADWAALAVQGLGELASHHIALAAPKRLIVFGGHILPLLGHDPANNPTSSAQINHGAHKIPLLALRDLAVLLERPRWKAGIWQSWLDWSQGNE